MRWTLICIKADAFDSHRHAPPLICNDFFVALLMLMSVAALALHLNQLGVLQFSSWSDLQLALDAPLCIMAVMGGRVIPPFTNNGVPGANATRHAAVETMSLGGVLLLATDGRPPMRCNCAARCPWCRLLPARRRTWSAGRSGNPGRPPARLWCGCCRSPTCGLQCHLPLRGLSEPGWAAPSVAVHALTEGAAGCLIIGTMTRTALGHTGRPLHASRWDVSCCLLVISAGLARVPTPLAASAQRIPAVLGSAALWSAGFALYAVRCWPVLTHARMDGKPG